MNMGGPFIHKTSRASCPSWGAGGASFVYTPLRGGGCHDDTDQRWTITECGIGDGHEKESDHHFVGGVGPGARDGCLR